MKDFFKYLPTSILGGLGVGAGKYAYDKGMFSDNQVSSLDPKQQELYSQLVQALQGGGGPLADIYGFDPEKVRENFDLNYAQPAYQKFEEEVIPGITGQFRGQNLQNSSYLGGALSKAGTDVQKGLDANLSNMLFNAEQQAIQRKQQGLQNLLNMQTFAYEQSPLMQLLQALAGGAGKAIGSYATGG